jgi:hypothetical protein
MAETPPEVEPTRRFKIDASPIGAESPAISQAPPQPAAAFQTAVVAKPDAPELGAGARISTFQFIRKIEV